MTLISQKEARRLQREVAQLKDRLADAAAVAERAERNENAAIERLAFERDRRRAISLPLTDEREIAEWNDVPEHIRTTVQVADRIGCVVVVKAETVQDYESGNFAANYGAGVKRTYLSVRSARRVP